MFLMEILRGSGVMAVLAEIAPESKMSSYYEKLEIQFALPEVPHPVDEADNNSLPKWVIDRGRDWAEIGQMIYQSSRVSDLENKKLDSAKGSVWHKSLSDRSIAARLVRAQQILVALKDFRHRYIKTFESSQTRDLNGFILLARGSVSYSLFNKTLASIDRMASPLKKLRGYRDCLIHFKGYVNDSLPQEYQAVQKGVLSPHDYDTVVSTQRFLFLKIAEVAKDISFLVKPNQREQVTLFLTEISQIVSSSIRQIDHISRVSSPPSYLPVLFSENVGVAIRSDSAEGKAIQRIANDLEEDEWEVSYKPGDTINISEIRNRLKQRVNG